MEKEMTAREFAHALNRMCDETMCCNCPLCGIECDITVTEKENIDKIVDVVTKWAKENPETKEEFPDELIIKVKPWDEALSWASEHLNTTFPGSIYGIPRKSYEKYLYGRSLHVKVSRSAIYKEHKVYRTLDDPYFFIPDGFIAEIVECIPNEEKPKPKVYPKHCLVKLVPYEEAMKREKDTALPFDNISEGRPWGISKGDYEAMQSAAVELDFCHHRYMNNGDHYMYTVLGHHGFFIPDIFIDEVIKDLSKEE